MVIGKDIHVEHSLYRGKDYVMIRRFFQDESGEWRPGRQGINLKWEEWKQFVENFEDIKKEINDSVDKEE
ncbi:MAG: transcriptional coactivator p15/PC4 family protein [archaeon]